MRKEEVQIQSIAFGAEGVGRLDNKVCFIEGALPGEKVVFEVLQDKKKYIRGKVLEVLEASDDRTKPVCQYYGICGGCHYQHISYEKELFYKQKQVDELIEKISKIKGFTCLDIVKSPCEYSYRSTVTLHRHKGKTGFFHEKTKNIVEISECPVMEEPLSDKLKSISFSSKRNDITLKSDFEGRVWSSEGAGERFFKDKYRDKLLYFSPRAFSQANRSVAAKLSETLENWIGCTEENTAFFDLYCGVGFFGFLLNSNFSKVIGIDYERTAIDCAKTTLKEHNRENFKFYKASVEQKFSEIYDRNKLKQNILLVDPPRTGIDGKLLENINNAEDVSKILYISCDPAKLARDIGILSEKGKWKLNKVQPFDMFPKTKHIEVLAEFVRV